MHYRLFPLLLTWLIGCQQHSTDQSNATPSDTSASLPALATKSDTICFRQVVKRDTTTVQLIINGERVTGFLDINLYEKDRAKGPLQGKIQGSTIRTDWSRFGEGVTEKYILNMIRSGDTLRWREEGAFVKDPTGKGWVATDVANDFQYEVIRTDCSSTSLP